MNQLLHIDSSIRQQESRSRILSAHFARQWQSAHPEGSITYRDLAINPIPHLDEAAYTSVFTPHEDRTPAQTAARNYGDVFIDEVLAADTIVIGLPLYNYGPPSTFMVWFDRILTPDRTMGLLGGKQFVFVMASGGGYASGTPKHGWDHREPWLRHAFAPLGVTDPVFITAELTLARESPAMIPLDLGAAEDKSLADALIAIDSIASRS